MSLLDIIFLAVALAMDCLTVSIVSGVIMRQKDATFYVIRMAFLFGLFQAMMPLIGWLGISHFQQYMEAYDHWIAFTMLAFIGGRMVWESFSPEEEQHFNPCHLGTQLLLAIATSIDALAVGISFVCTGYERVVQLWMPLLIIGVVSMLFSLVGWHLGVHFGRSIARRLRPELVGGIILIGIGVKILLEHLFDL